MKIAIAGKGGVGKTFIAGTLARFFARDFKVLAIDNDPSMNLIYSLGMNPNLRKEIKPISEMSKLIQERTMIQGEDSGIYNVNPYVSDIPDQFKIKGPDNIELLVLGTIEVPSSGCFCVPNALIRALLADLILKRNEVVIIDFEAGLEHLGRGTSKGLDIMLIVTEPYQKSLDLSEKILNLARKMEIKNLYLLGNNLDSQNPREKDLITEWAYSHKIEVIGLIPHDDAISKCELEGKAPYDAVHNSNAIQELKKIYIKLKEIYVNS